MSIIKCKMCGGDMVLSSDNTIGTCEYCGSTMTLPKIDDEKRLALYNRANHFRQQCAFDKAAQIYENIVSETPDDAEAHWSLVLCRYGIEYVEDPETFERIPTCHRASYDSIFDDIDYQEAVKNSDGIATTLYQKEARRIDRIQKGILEISKNEEPFDVFICYKETAVNGDRTLDSVKAQEIYDELTEKGYKVFFSRITLESKLGQAYEPYIFAALNSAKVMLVVGTSPENMNAVWVKNEWSRYLKLTKKDKNKTIIPCYLNMDPYDLPNEFFSLQAQDMSKIGFVQDLIRGIDKLVSKKQQTDVSVASNQAQSDNSNAISFGFMKYEMGKTDEASTVFNNILQKDITCPEAYLGLAVLTGGADFETYCKKFSQYASKEMSRTEYSVITEQTAKEILKVYFKLKDIKRISSVLERFPKVVDDKLLISAVYESQYEKVISLLIEHGANLNATIELDHNSDADIAEGCSDKRSLLSYVIMKHYSPQAVEALLKCGASPNSVRILTNKYGSTEYSVLSDAIRNAKNVEIVKMLLEYGADPNRIENIIFDEGGKGKKSMLTYAVYDAKSPEMVKLLLEHGANPNSARIYNNKYGSTEYSVLSDAIWYIKNIEIVKILLEYGADPNRIENITYDDGSKGKDSMLSYAVHNAKSLEMVKLLLKYGASMEDKITLCGITKKFRKYPFDKHYNLSGEFLKGLRSLGWSGSLF